MSLRHLTLLRRLSTTRTLQRPALSADYKSKQLWEERFDCPLLGSDSTLIKTINNKIISSIELNSIEIDVFINIAVSRGDDTSQLQEALKSLRKFRRSIHANTLLPSTPHALCRLFINSERIPSLLAILEHRVEYGIFPDSFSLNLLLDAALEKENYAMVSRLASLIMLQEEFGKCQLNDNFSLYGLAKYIESKTDFSDWNQYNMDEDPVFREPDDGLPEESKKDADAENKKKQDNDHDDEDDDEVEKEYVRIPFLRNPYHDEHFDLKEPRIICGKSLSMLGLHHLANEASHKLGLKCKLAGEILRTNWTEAQTQAKKCLEHKVATNALYTDSLKHYIENSEDKMPSDRHKKTLMSDLDKLSSGGQSLSEEAEQRHEQLRDLERQDIERLRGDIVRWSESRLAESWRKEEIKRREKLIAQIKAKKEELKAREQYLYFYDNLKKSNLTRIDYE